MSEHAYEYIQGQCAGIKRWTKGLPVEDSAMEQAQNVAALPFIHRHIALMPDVHTGYGATVGSVIPTKGAVIPAAVGVDIGCGMMAAKLSITQDQLPDSLQQMRFDIEASVPVGFKQHRDDVRTIPLGLAAIEHAHPKIGSGSRNDLNQKARRQMGTLGGGNHFIEVCVDTEGSVWVMLHSGSRGVGNLIGRYFMELAKEQMRTHFINLPDTDLSYLPEGTEYFDDYIYAVGWAQDYARANREYMMTAVLRVIATHLPEFEVIGEAVNCHHNYVERENHFGANVLVTRKGAVRARKGDLGIIPGSMGAKSFIVRGLGNPESFHSCSHGAGRVMSRKKAKALVSLDEHKAAVAGVECRVDEGVIDETPSAYKDIDTVMAAQSDLVEIVAQLKQVLCVKG